MKKDITISNEIGGVFETGGEYENERHKIFYSITYKDVDWGLDRIEEESKAMASVLRNELEYRGKQSHIKALQARYKDIRWYDAENGEQYPSVTSVITFANPKKWFVNEAQLRGLCARGKVGDTILEKYIKTGKWIEPKDIPECAKDLYIMKTEGYELEGNLPAFVEKYKLKFPRGHFKVVNHKHKYAGEADCEVDFGDDIPTIADLKWFLPDKDGKIRTFKQIAAYAKASGKEYDRMAILPLNGKTNQGYSAPIFTSSIDEYFELFLNDRKDFTETFGV